jgi:hypothetical protein
MAVHRPASQQSAIQQQQGRPLSTTSTPMLASTAWGATPRDDQEAAAVAAATTHLRSTAPRPAPRRCVSFQLQRPHHGPTAAAAAAAAAAAGAGADWQLRRMAGLHLQRCWLEEADMLTDDGSMDSLVTAGTWATDGTCAAAGGSEDEVVDCWTEVETVFTMTGALAAHAG